MVLSAGLETNVDAPVILYIPAVLMQAVISRLLIASVQQVKQRTSPTSVPTTDTSNTLSTHIQDSDPSKDTVGVDNSEENKVSDVQDKESFHFKPKHVILIYECVGIFMYWCVLERS